MQRNVLYTVEDEDAAIRALFLMMNYKPIHNRKDELEQEKEIDPFFTECICKMDRQVRYRLRREASLSWDEPSRLPCRPLYDNGDERSEEETRQYQQPRVTQDEIDPKHEAENVDVCYTCTNHRFCTGPVCEARVLTCTYCESVEGPLRVRYNRKVAARAKKLDLKNIYITKNDVLKFLIESKKSCNLNVK